MAKRNAHVNSAFVLPVAIAAASLFAVSVAGTATAAGLRVVTPGEQNTQSGENGCAAAPCAANHWLHYPEILSAMLGAGYSVVNNGDGGAVLGCDAATAAAAGGNSICANGGNYSKSINPLPDIVIIGPFGEHDQRIVATNAALYDEATFEAAYDGLVTNYLNLSSHPKVYMMTPIDITPTWNGAAATLGTGKDIVKDIMLPAALAVATKHSLVVIDTYTAMSPGGVLDTAYMPADGQVNSAGQQKMAMMILDALQSDAGTPAGTGSSSGAATTGSTSGSTSGTASGASTAGSTSGAATTGSTGSGAVTSGSTTTGTPSTAGTVTASGSGTTSGTSTTGSGMTQTGTGASAGTGGGATAGTSTSGTPVETAPATKSSSGCALSSGRSSSAVGLGLLALGLVAVRRRRSA
jgi:MYXO-CTERM domain-containing protein